MPSSKGAGLAAAATLSEAQKIVATAKRDAQASKPSSNVLHAARPNESLRCPICERKFQRRARQQLYCSRPCMRKANYARKASLGLLSGQDSALVPNPHKSVRETNALQMAISRSSASIIGPRKAIDAEIIGGREWQEIVSSDGVTSYVSQLTKRVLV